MGKFKYLTVTTSLLLVLQPWGVLGFDCDLGRPCVQLKDCPLVIQQLRLAQTARSDGAFGAMNRILESIRSIMCDVETRNVCCPKYIGTLKIPNTANICPVYALNSTSVRVMDWPVYGELDTIESYFWRDSECIPFQEFDILNETASLNYSVEKSEMDVNLPPSLSIQEARCLAIWKNDEYSGYAHLKLPVGEDLDDNTIE